MKIHCKILNQDFESKTEMFNALKTHEKDIISFKKSQTHKSAEKGQLSMSGVNLKIGDAEKAGIETKEGYVYPVINTTNYMDSHDDVHFPNIWNKTKKEQNGRIFYIDGHDMTSIDNVIAWPKDVNIITQSLDWTYLGADFVGKTEALIFEIPEVSIRKDVAKGIIADKLPVQGSISMIYVKITMGIDSKDKAYATNKAYFDSRINSIANKDKVKEQGYFFGIEEAKIAGEGSMVLKGSNNITPIKYHEAADKALHDEPPQGTQKKSNILLNF